MDTEKNIRISITEGPLPALHSTPTNRLSCEGAGAMLRFDGIVRPTEDDRPIDGIAYEAYEPMAQNALRELARTAIEKFGVLAITVEHSKGMVPNSMCSFRLQVASTHRKEGLAALDWFIDEMKRDVPLWKHHAWSSVLPNSEEVNDA